MQHAFALLTRILDAVLSWIPRAWDLLPLVLLSIMAGFMVLLVYRFVSSPAKIKDSKNKIKAHILAIRLYKDEWRVILKSFFLSLLATLRYFALNTIPLLILLPLLAPLFAQLEVRYGLSPFQPGALVDIKGTFTASLDTLEPELIPDAWYKLSMDPVYVYAKNEAHWQIEILKPGQFVLGINTSQGKLDKKIRCGDEDKRPALSEKRHSGALFDGLLYPVELPLKAADPAAAIRIHYPGRLFEIAGFGVHWIWLHLLIVIVLVLALKKRFGIEF